MSNMNNRKDTGTKPSQYNTETRVIDAHHFKIGSLLEAHNALKESMDLADPYKVCNLTDEMMHINKETFSLAHQWTQAHKSFIDGLSFHFPTAIFTFKHYGSLCNGLAVCKMKHGDTTSNKGFHGLITETTQTAPVLLSCQETKDAVDNIAFAYGHNKHLSKAILMAVLSDRMLPSFDDDAAASQYVDGISRAILALWCEGE
eukprot:1331819-Ditylum_brightwellii.AAC.1